MFSQDREYRISVWTFIATMFGALIGIVTVLVPFYLRSVYSLQVVTLANNSLASITSELSSDIQLLYKGTPTMNIVLIETKLENTGNQPIRSTDFERPLEFEFPPHATVLNASVLATRNIGYSPTISYSQSAAEIAPLLLNPDSSVVMQFLVSSNVDASQPVTYEVKSSIANIPELAPIAAVDSVSRSAQDDVTWLVVMCAVPIVILLLVSLFFAYFLRK